MSIVQVYLPVCDRCGDCDHTASRESESELESAMTKDGWTKGDEGDICPDCSEEDEERASRGHCQGG